MQLWKVANGVQFSLDKHSTIVEVMSNTGISQINSYKKIAIRKYEETAIFKFSL